MLRLLLWTERKTCVTEQKSLPTTCHCSQITAIAPSKPLSTFHTQLSLLDPTSGRLCGCFGVHECVFMLMCDTVCAYVRVHVCVSVYSIYASLCIPVQTHVRTFSSESGWSLRQHSLHPTSLYPSIITISKQPQGHLIKVNLIYEGP